MAATDNGSPMMASNTSLSVTVTDINDSPPEFSDDITFGFTLLENLPSESVIGTFEVTDRDQGLAAEVSITLEGVGSERFSVEIVNVTRMSSANSQPPVVTLARIVTTEVLDREDVEVYLFTLTAEDRSSQPLISTIPVNVTVLDMNDNTPFFSSPSFTFSISEGTTDLTVMDFNVSMNAYLV